VNLTLDSDVLVYALNVPGDKNLRNVHIKSSKLYKSCITGDNKLLLPTTILVESVSALSKIITPEFAKASREDIVDNASEIFPVSPKPALYSMPDNQRYVDLCLEYATNFSIKKDPADSYAPGLKDDASEVKISGMDIFILAYSDLRSTTLITNDWSLWYIAWKSGISAYWISGLRDEQIDAVRKGRKIEYPVKVE